VKREIVRSLPSLPGRATDAHKGAVGRIVVIGGRLDDRGMLGAPALTANGAFRSGAGLVQIITDRAAMPHVHLLAPCATTRARESGQDLAAMAIEFGADVVAIGPGLSPNVTDDEVVGLLTTFSGGIVVDADALNALARVREWTAKWPHNVVLTPHPGEMRRLREASGLPPDFTDRREAASDLADRCGCTVVLKGAGTVVADTRRLYVNETGNAGMATAGTGDVLTGVIAALMGQNLSAFDAAVLGVHVHGLAGDNAAEELGRLSLMAIDLLDFLPEAFCDMEDRRAAE
jgi:NAD(P)H-hydrate epimerase